ncbi:hypothetical protein KFK14_01405 [Sphingobium phenoxybenzoativorans]|uniref:Uncharacterized protein n=1 Tax=Sphingobium phenoxybenzoativorans TaxID=1592790 RepID=A0A975Q274_9SPHN|nr:hypothetical protein [Sphingobium phenoxybenzoativorans]QUT06177.1 hypothetical protein KFK14_01405 [Sphingobium phenoxybenzoativorans]
MRGGSKVAAALLPLAMAACSAVPQAAPVAAPPPPPASAYGRPVEVMGADAKKLIAMFGQPRLDIREKTVRKLQFANSRCVLDAYLYMTDKGKTPVVTYVDTRLPDGRDTAQQPCAMALAGK